MASSSRLVLGAAPARGIETYLEANAAALDDLVNAPAVDPAPAPATSLVERLVVQLGVRLRRRW